MAAVELDPHFIKALRLLRSKSKDSGAQLRAMLDDAIRQKKGLGPAPRSPSVSKQHSRSVSSDRAVDKDRSEKDKKKDLDRLKKDLSELADKPTDPKRARLDSPALSSASHTPSPTPPPSRGEGGDASDGGGSEVEFGDLEMNLEFDCSCCVCKTFTQESGNKLMECSSCQNLYHQECHAPPVSNHEASDPRLIWNCVKCTKKSVPGAKPAASTPVVKEEKKPEKDKSSKSSISSGSSSKRSSSSSRHKPSPAKSDSGRGSSVTGSSGSSKSKSGSSSGASSSSGTGASNTDLSSSARKRIKLIKKQAAAATSGISKKKSK